MDRTTIMLPPDLKTRVANKAKKLRISMGQYIRETLKKSLETENSSETNDDSLFQDKVVFEDTIPKNLVSDHDGYLYGNVK